MPFLFLLVFCLFLFLSWLLCPEIPHLYPLHLCEGEWAAVKSNCVLISLRAVKTPERNTPTAAGLQDGWKISEPKAQEIQLMGAIMGQHETFKRLLALDYLSYWR